MLLEHDYIVAMKDMQDITMQDLLTEWGCAPPRLIPTCYCPDLLKVRAKNPSA